MTWPAFSSMSEEFPVLEHPPIVEVVCGISFAPVPLDVMDLGVYWNERRSDYPVKSLQPALMDGNEFVLGNPPMRAMLSSGNSVRILQLQHDRFVMNWRAVGEGYPRFSTRTESGPGLRDQALEEFQRFADFCLQHLGTMLMPKRIELMKVDSIERGRHWHDLDDLTKLVRVTGTFDSVHLTGNREFGLRFVEHDEERKLLIGLASVFEKPGGQMKAARLETRAIQDITSETDLRSAFAGANSSVNRVFFTLVSEEELHRFGTTKEVER
jgi:uncharacterized protein (TIGR04255 family)